MHLFDNFLVLRYSLVEEAQRAIIAEALPEPKGAAAISAIQTDREFARNNVRYAFVGFVEVEPDSLNSFPRGRYFAGKVAKLRKAHVGEKIPGDIIEHEEDDWIPLVTVLDVEAQLLFVQRYWKFGTDAQIARAIETGLREPVLAKYNYRVFVEARSRKENFWNVVRSHSKVYRLELRLISPNILDTNTKARDALDALKSLYGQDEIGITLENDSGALAVPDEPISDYVDYIAEGEGRWAVVTEGDHGGKKKHTSESEALSIQLPVRSEEEIYSEGQLELETGAPAPGRRGSDVRLIAEVHSEGLRLKRNEEDD